MSIETRFLYLMLILRKLYLDAHKHLCIYYYIRQMIREMPSLRVRKTQYHLLSYNFRFFL